MAKSIYQSTQPDITYIAFDLKFSAYKVLNNFTETYIYLFAYSFQSSLNYSLLFKIQTIG